MDPDHNQLPIGLIAPLAEHFTSTAEVRLQAIQAWISTFSLRSLASA